MSDKEIREQIAKAAELVGTWPDWKRNILAQSSKPSVSTPRVPVNNQAIDNDQNKTQNSA